MIDLKERKRDWSVASANGGQNESQEGGQSGRRVFVIAFLCFILAVSSLMAQTGERLFRTDIEHNIKIDLYKPSDWDSIKVRFHNSVTEDLVYTPVRIDIDHTVFDSVGLSIKGNTYVDFNSPSMFYPFKIDMNEFVKGQKFDNIKKFNLNNKEYDNNIVMNNIYAAFGLPYCRTSKAAVYISNTWVGEYLILEQVDNTYLKRVFGNDEQNLYKGDNQAYLDWLGGIQKYYESRYSLKNNEEINDYSDLIHFIDILNNSNNPALEDSVKSHFDLENYMKILSLQVLMGKHDDYFDKGHNYYLYHNGSDDRFSFIPYDNDMVLYPGNNLFMTQSQRFPLFGFIFGSKNLRQQYVSCMCSVMNKIESAIPPIELKYHADFSAYKDYVSSSIFARTIEIADAGYHCSSTSIINSAESQLLMYISRNSLFVESPKQMSVHLEIFSMSGQVVYQQDWKPAENNTGTINLEFLKAGMYVARLRNDQAVFSLKITISGR